LQREGAISSSLDASRVRHGQCHPQEAVVSSASYRRKTRHAAMPDREEIVAVCYHYHRGTSYDANCLALYERRVVRVGPVDCRSCTSVLRQYPQLLAQWMKRNDAERVRAAAEGSKAALAAVKEGRNG